MNLRRLLQAYSTVEVRGEANREIQGITDDSRAVEKNFLFVAVKGHTVDGHDYIKAAIDKGACGIVYDGDISHYDEGICFIKVDDSQEALGEYSYIFYGEPDKKLVMVGITGTNGKTSSTYFIKNILEHKGYKVGVIGTNGAVVNQERFELPNTTPYPLLLHKCLAMMVDAGCEYCIMEVSSHGLKLGRTKHIHFDYGLFTNLTQDHLDFHLDMEDYYLSKRSLFDQVRKKAIINKDDPYGARLIEEVEDKLEVISYGIDEEADVVARNIVYHLNAVDYTLQWENGEEETIHVRTPGKFTVYNTLMAAILTRELGCKAEDISEGLGEFAGVKGRFQVVKTDTPYHVIIDFAHTSDSLEKILQTIQEFKTGRLVTLFGAGGDRDRTKRPLMGQVAGKYSDFVIVTSDNPRSEDPEVIISDIIAGLEPVNKNFVRIVDRREAIYYAIDHAEKEDIIVLAGKGHETYVLEHGIKHPFDEEAIVLDYVKSKRKTRGSKC